MQQYSPARQRRWFVSIVILAMLATLAIASGRDHRPTRTLVPTPSAAPASATTGFAPDAEPQPRCDHYSRICEHGLN